MFQIAPLRCDEISLFVGLKKPHKSVAAKTLSRWVKEAFSGAGIDVAVWGSRSGRSASAAHQQKTRDLNHMQLCKLGDWSSTSGVFKKFYLKYM